MTELLSQTEALPENYPEIDGITDEAEAAAIWQRIEHYTAYRFTARLVTWRVASEGGDWTPPLRPVSDLTVRKWDGTAFSEVDPIPAPGGYTLTSGQFEITATVGAGPVPAIVAKAAKRLADYMAAQNPVPAGARSYSADAGQLKESIDIDPAAQAKALQNSGAADLLRLYRRV